MSIFKKIVSMMPWSRRDCNGRPCSSKEGLIQARRQDMAGNYDLDGVSYDGDNLYMSGRIRDSRSYKDSAKTEPE